MRDCRWRLPNVLQQLHEEKNWVAEATKELAGRQLRARVAQLKWLLRQEVAERRGAARSVKKSPNKEK